MSRRIRRGRRGIDLPLKDPPTSTDRLIGHDANGNMRQFLLDALLADISLRINAAGVVAQVWGRLQITARKPPGTTGIYELTAPAGWVWHSAVGGGGTSAIRSVSVENSGSQTVRVHVFSGAGNPV